VNKCYKVRTSLHLPAFALESQKKRKKERKPKRKRKVEAWSTGNGVSCMHLHRFVMFCVSCQYHVKRAKNRQFGLASNSNYSGGVFVIICTVNFLRIRFNYFGAH